MLLTRITVLLLCTFIPIGFCRHITSSSEEEATSKSTGATRSTAVKRQLKKTHLRLHGKPPKTLHLQEGDSDFLECQAGGTPAPTIHWLKDGNIIPQTGNVQSESQKSSDSGATNSKKRTNVSFTTSRLYLDCLSVEDEGEYTCVAENPYHRISSSTMLIVMSSDDEIECEKKSRGQAPRITFWTKAMIGTQGENVRFSCRAEGYPKPTIRWQGTQGEELTSEDFDKFEISAEGDLIVKKINWSDLGNYNCIAENIHGSSKVETFLYPSIADK